MSNMTWVGILAQRRSRSGLAFYLFDQLALFLEEDHVAHFAVHPHSQEDEAMLRLAPGNLGRSPSAEKHANIGDFIPRGRPRHILGCVLKCSLRGTNYASRNS